MARILIIEADVQIRKFIAGILGDFGHDVHQCADLDDGSGIAASRFDVLVTDLVLVPATGEALALSRILPSLTLTGEPHDAAIANRSPPLRDRPFRFADLTRLVAEVARYALDIRVTAV